MNGLPFGGAVRIWACWRQHETLLALLMLDHSLAGQICGQLTALNCYQPFFPARGLQRPEGQV